jgi:hypothetical protein
MPETTFDQAYPVARALARQKAISVIGSYGLTSSDREDIEADLLLDFFERLPKFDSSRASLRTFASRLMDRKLASILRYRSAKCRTWQNQVSVDDLAADFEEPILYERRERFWLDVDRALAALPPALCDVLRETAAALSWNSPSELSRDLGKSRTIIYQHIHQIRAAFTAAGISRTYLTALGAKQ